MKVVLYTTNCPKCSVLEKKLGQKQIEYERVDDINILQEKGFLEAPKLEVDGEIMNFVQANDWVNKQ